MSYLDLRCVLDYDMSIRLEHLLDISLSISENFGSINTRYVLLDNS